MSIQSTASLPFSQPMRYETLCWGPFSVEQVRFTKPAAQFNPTFTSDDRTRIELLVSNAQRKAIAAGKRFFNSELFRLGQIESVVTGARAGVVFRLGSTSYFDYVATRTLPHEGNNDRFANPLGTGIILVTSDGFIPFGRRSPDLDVNSGRLFSFGGFFDPAVDVSADGTPDLFGCFLRELYEETGISVERHSVSLLGVIYDHLHPHPEAIALATPAQVSASDIRQCKWNEELADLDLIHVSQLRQYVADNHGDITEGMLGGLEGLLASTQYEKLLALYIEEVGGL